MRILPAAESDIVQARDYYREQEDLGEALLEELDACFARVSENPLSYAEVEPGIRRALLHRFPFIVFYTFHEDVVVVLAIIHAAQDPEYVRSRLDA